MRTNTFSFYALLLLLICLPIPLGANRVWAWSLVSIWVGVMTMGMLSSYCKDWRQFPVRRLLRFAWLLAPMLAFQLWVVIQLLPLPISWLTNVSPLSASVNAQLGVKFGSITLDTYATLSTLQKGFTYLLFAINAIVLVNTPRKVKWVLAALLASGTFQAFYGAMVVLLGLKHSLVFELALPDVATGSFVYKNHLANYLMLCLCAGAGLLVSQLHVSSSSSWRERLARWIGGVLSIKMFVRIALIVMVIGLVMTRSRMGNTAFFAATLIGGVAALMFYRSKPRALVALIVSLLVIDTFVVGSVFGLAKVKQRLEETALTAETRDEVVAWSAEIIESVPIVGSGGGSFYTVFPAFSHSNLGFYDHAHNEYVQFAVEFGIPATIMLGVMCLYAIWLCVFAMRNRNSKTLKGTALGCLMAVVGMLIHISVDFNLQPTANAMTFVLILVLCGVSARMQIGTRREVQNPANTSDGSSIANASITLSEGIPCSQKS